MDVILALLPWTILFHMRPSLNIKERLGVAIAMSMGILYEHTYCELHLPPLGLRITDLPC